MRLQQKLSLVILISLFISAFLSVAVINIFILLFDKNYSKYNPEETAEEIAYKISIIEILNEEKINDIFEEYREYKDVLFFTFFTRGGKLFVTTDYTRPPLPKHFDEPPAKEFKDKFMLEERNKFRFINYFNQMDFVIRKPIPHSLYNDSVLEVSVRKEYLFPFYLRINSEKVLVIYALVFTMLFLIITLSYLFILLMTFPLIKRLKRIYETINSFELEGRLAGINDDKQDEIGEIARIFDTMSNKITDNYNDMKRFYYDRQELLKNISHDFRTPLTSILGYAASLEDGIYENEKEKNEYYTIIRKKAQYMSLLFDEMLELTRLGNDTYLLRKQDFDFAELLRSIIIEYIPQFEKEEFEVITDIPDTLIINADCERLSRAVRNIIDNLIKHGKEGKTAEFSLLKKGKEIVLVIKDYGIGIPDKLKTQVFDRFYRINSNTGGMGIGLTIAKDITDKHGGSLSITDNPKGGAVFTITIPEK